MKNNVKLFLVLNELLALLIDVGYQTREPMALGRSPEKKVKGHSKAILKITYVVQQILVEDL